MSFFNYRIYIKQLFTTILYVVITSIVSIVIYLNFADNIITKSPDFLKGLDSISYLIYFILLFILNKKNSLIIYKKNRNKNYYHILIVLLLSVLYFVFSDIVFNYKSLFSNIYKPDLQIFEYSSTQNIFIGLNSLLLIPIFEELVFRRIILNSLLEKKGIITSVLFSSLLFSIIHINFYPFYFPVTKSINALLLGIVLGAVYYKYGFVYSILLHSCFNFLTIIINRNPFKYWDVLTMLDFGILYWSIILFSLLLIILILYFSKPFKHTPFNSTN